MEKTTLKYSLLTVLIALLLPNLEAAWMDEVIVNTETVGKQASRGIDCPWSLTAGFDGRVHIVWEDRRAGRELNIYYRGKSPSSDWNNWDETDINISPVDTTALMGHPSVGILHTGTVISVFVEEKPFRGELLGAVFQPDSTNWNQPEFVSLPGGLHLTFTSTGWQTTIATNGDCAITFWPYVGEEPNCHSIIFYRRYQANTWEEQEIPLELPEVGLDYDAINLSSVWGYGDNVYLVFAGMFEGAEIYSIYFVKLNFNTGQLLEFENITQESNFSQEFPYICWQPGDSLNEDIYIVFNGKENVNTAKLVFKRAGMTGWSNIFYPGDQSRSSGHPCLAASPSGTIELAFEQPCHQPESQIYHQTFFPGPDTFGVITHVSGGTHFSKRPVIACDIFGNVHIIYISNRIYPDELGNEEVFYRMYDAPPLPPTDVYQRRDAIGWGYHDLPDLLHFEIFLINELDTTLIGSTSDTFFVHNYGPEASLGVRAVDLVQQFSLMSTESAQRGAAESPIAPVKITLGKNYPNPFNSYTSIPVFNSYGKTAIVEIYNLLGELITKIKVEANQTRVVWDGTNQRTQTVSSGIYLYRAVCNNNYSVFKRMVLIK